MLCIILFLYPLLYSLGYRGANSAIFFLSLNDNRVKHIYSILPSTTYLFLIKNKNLLFYQTLLILK